MDEIIKNYARESTTATPGRLSEICLDLTAYTATLIEKLGDLQTNKASKWLEIRATVKSDTLADRTWDATEDGLAEMRLKMELKYVERLISSIKVRLRSKENEARNIY